MRGVMRRYCLYCFSTLPEKGNRCERCDQTTNPLDYRLFWNRNPRIVNIEQTIKILTVVLTGLVVLFIFITVGGLPMAGPRAGWLFLLPFVPAVGIWKTASGLTHTNPYFHPQIFWIALFALLGVVLVFVDPYLAPISLACILGVILTGRRLRRWKRRLIS